MTHIFLIIAVLFISLMNTIGLFSIADMYHFPVFSSWLSTHATWFYAFLWIQLPVIYFLVMQAYINPIQRLSREIAAFVTGIREDPTGLEANSISNGMNYVTSFFIRSLQILKIFKNELRSGRQLKSEVEIASEIQQTALEHPVVTIPSLKVAYAIKSATEVGGDSCDIIEGIEGNHYLYVGDATGHGVPSGFIMMMVNSLISAIAKLEVSSATILALTNKVVKPRVKQNMLMSCVLLRWNEQEKRMYFSGAGHEYLLVYKLSENKVYPIKSGGVAIGMIKDISKILKEQQIAFDEGDIIVLYTDGISEARYQSTQNGILFGHDRIVSAILKPQDKTVDNIFQQITIDLSAFMGYKHRQYDDITLMVIQYASGQGYITTDAQNRINTSNITEWNWGGEITPSE